MPTTKKHIVIIGAGFAGLRIARMLNNHPAYDITLIDKNNYHQFQPLMYQVATANLDASNISFPLRNIFHKSKNVRIRVTEVLKILADRNTIETTTGNIAYDYLVIATGADTNYFGNHHVQEHSFPMKSTVEALQLRNQMIHNLEEASVTTDPVERERLLSIVVVGGGPTGIELSGALVEMKKETLPKDYPELNPELMHIWLVEGNDKLLGGMREQSSLHAHKYLERMGVVVKTSTIVKDYDGKEVLMQDGSRISAALVIWAAGVKGTLPSGLQAGLIAPGNRIRVDRFNKVGTGKNIFAVGDIAFMESPGYPKGFPQLASVAIDQAENVADNFKRMVSGRSLRVFYYRNKGTMATIGRNKAVVDIATPAVSFKGYFAWIVWMTLHLFLLIGFKNRIIVFINWVYKYFTHNQSLSLMFGSLARNRMYIAEHMKRK